MMNTKALLFPPLKQTKKERKKNKEPERSLTWKCSLQKWPFFGAAYSKPVLNTDLFIPRSSPVRAVLFVPQHKQ